MKKILFSAIFILIFVATVRAEVTIKSETDKTKISTDEALTYKIIVTSTETGVPPPQPQKLEGFAVVSSANSSTVNFTGGGVKSILVHAFILAPMKTGKLKIPPAVIKMKDKTISSQEITIEVTQGKRKIVPLPQQKPGLPQQPLGKQTPEYTL